MALQPQARVALPSTLFPQARVGTDFEQTLVALPQVRVALLPSTRLRKVLASASSRRPIGVDPPLLAAFQEAIEHLPPKPNKFNFKKRAATVLRASGIFVGGISATYLLLPMALLATAAMWAGCVLYVISSVLRAVWRSCYCKFRGYDMGTADALAAKSVHEKTATEVFADVEYRFVIGGRAREEVRTDADRASRMAQLREKVRAAAS